MLTGLFCSNECVWANKWCPVAPGNVEHAHECMLHHKGKEMVGVEESYNVGGSIQSSSESQINWIGQNNLGRSPWVINFKTDIWSSGRRGSPTNIPVECWGWVSFDGNMKCISVSLSMPDSNPISSWSLDNMLPSSALAWSLLPMCWLNHYNYY